MVSVRNLPFWRRYTTKQNTNYWARRKDNWFEYLETWNHPHRYFITSILARMSFVSLIEIGCGSGPNLKNVVVNLKGKQVGGIDVNPEAIALAQKTFIGGHFSCESAEDIFMSDKSVDVTLTDMFLIYVGPFKIKKYLKEMLRITRNHVVLCEYYEKSWWRRQYLRIFSGRHSYNYKKLLHSLGCYDIIDIKIPEFEKDNEQRFRYLIVARVPKNV